MIKKNQVYQLMKNIEDFTRMFKRMEFTGLSASKKKFFVRLSRYSNHTLSIWYEPKGFYRVQITIFTNGAKKEQTIGCTFDFDKKGTATFYGNNGHNKPELFKGLIKNFFSQAKEDIMD